VTKEEVTLDQPASPERPPGPNARLQFREVRKLALGLLMAHGLHGWSFAFNWRKRSMGLCAFSHRRIELSVHFVERNNHAEILDTILHEIAHALVGPGHGHDAVWKTKCIEIGAKPLRCGEADMPESRWHARCGACGKSFHRYRRPKRLRGWFCQDCGPQVGALIWREQLLLST
jgi:predicted SprT family Zn-dependent metalloprotease